MLHLYFCSSMREFLQNNPSHLWKKYKKGVADVGGGFLTALTAVREGGLSEQEMTWPPLCKTGPPRQQLPQLWASWVTTSTHRGLQINSRETGLRKSADSGGENLKMIDDFKGIRCINSFKIKMWVTPLLFKDKTLYLISAAVSPVCAILDPQTLPITSLHNRKLVKQLICCKYEYSFEQTNYVSGRRTVDCNNRSTLHLLCLFYGFVICTGYIGVRHSLVHTWPSWLL